MDVVGKRFGSLSVIEYAGTDRNNKTRWLCECECGQRKVVIGSQLRSGGTKSCGCLRHKIDNLAGQTFGRWSVIRRGLAITYGDRSRTTWFCVCLCGTERVISAHTLICGDSQSCGCLKNEASSKRLQETWAPYAEARREWANSIGWESMSDNDLRSLRMEYNGRNPYRREEVWEKSEGVCHLCVGAADQGDWHVDHVQPILLGGRDEIDNVAVAHPKCNLSKGAGDLSGYCFGCLPFGIGHPSH